MSPRMVKVSRKEFRRLLDQVIKIPSAKLSPICKERGCDGKLTPVSFNCSKVVNHECDECKKLYCCEETLQKEFERIVLVSIGQNQKKLSLVS